MQPQLIVCYPAFIEEVLMCGFPSGPRLLAPVFVLLTTVVSLCSAIELDPKEFMPVEEIQPGMKGYGLTVFAGTRIDTFQVEILGVEKKAWAKKDLIWGRLQGGPLADTGVIAGMSGSPVYIDGRLVGAVGYGFGYSKEPLAGITPIAQMFEALERQRGGKPGSPGRDRQGGMELYPEFNFGSGLTPEGMAQGFDPGLDLKFGGAGRLPKGLASLGGGGEYKVVPLATPLMISGMDHEAFEMMAPTFEHLGFLPLEAGGGSGSAIQSPTLEAGAGVGVQFVRGDLNMAGVGTVTYRKGEDIVAFGHSMNLLGEVEVPMTTVDVHFVVPHLIQAFKFASPIEVVGALTQDRLTAVAGVIGQVPDMLPVSIKLEEAGKTEEFSYEIMRSPLFAPGLAGTTVIHSIASAGKVFGDYVVEIKVQADLEGYPPVLVENVFSSMMAPFEAAQITSQMVFLLLGNDFEQAKIKNISVEIALLEQRKSAVLEAIRVDRGAIRPGGQLEVALSIRPYLEDTVIKRVSLQVPEDVPEGMLELRAYDAKTAYAMERRRGPARFRPRNMAELIGLLEELPRNNEIVVDLFLRRTGATVGATELPSLPASMLGVLQTARQSGGTGLTQGTNVVRARIPLDFVIAGNRTLRLQVDRRAR
jgi:hypothetical protein